MTVFIFRSSVVSRLFGFLSRSAIQSHLEQLADYYGAYYDSDITVIHY